MCFAHNLFPHPLHPCFQETFLLWRRSKLFPAYFPRQVIFPTSEAWLASPSTGLPSPCSFASFILHCFHHFASKHAQRPDEEESPPLPPGLTSPKNSLKGRSI